MMRRLVRLPLVVNFLGGPRRVLTDFAKRYPKELLIAFVMAAIAALTIEHLNEHTAAEILRSNLKAVALIKTYKGKREPGYQGSGVFVDNQGTLMTSYHLIEGMDPAQTEAKLPSGAYYKFKGVRSVNKKADVAILQFDAQDTPYARMGDSDKVVKGQRVFSIGAPLGLENSVSEGVISDPKRNLSGREFIQFTAAISSGSSGGGLFDAKGGGAIGIVTNSYVSSGKETTVQNLNLAVPINVVKKSFENPHPTLTESSPEFWYSEGVSAKNKRQYEKAIGSFEKAIVIDRTYVDAYIKLGNIYHQQRRYDEQINILRTAVAFVPYEPDAWFFMAEAYENTQQYESAAAAYRKGLELNPDDSDSLFQLGVVYIVLGEKDKARELVPKLIRLNPGRGSELRTISE